MKELTEELGAAIAAAKEMGEIQLRHFRKPLRVVRKAPKELVSNVDILCQRSSKELLEGFDYPRIVEESVSNGKAGDLAWVIDPVDGTHNFIAGLPDFGVSIALAGDRGFVLGVICLPFFKEMYHAVIGKGAFLNGERISVSRNKDLEKGVVAYDNQFHLAPGSFGRYKKVAEASFTTRVSGCAARDLAFISAGRLDARAWNRTKAVDFAAGTVLVREAGGKVTDFGGNGIGLDSWEVVASNGGVHEKLLEALK